MRRSKVSAVAEVSSPHVNYLPSEAERVTILSWFSVISYQGHHDLASEGRVAGTGQWLFQREEFRHWQESEKSEILWLHGIRKSSYIVPSSIPCVPAYACAC